MGRPKYPEITKTEVGRRLYWTWVRIHKEPCSPAFKDFLTFYEWAIKAGYTGYEFIRRLNNSLPYSEENCYCYLPGLYDVKSTGWNKMFATKWNETVNRIRRHYGMPPVEELELEEEGEDGKEEPTATED